MAFRQAYPIITTHAVVACRDFYTRLFDAEVIFDSPWYVQIRLAGQEMGFSNPDDDHPRPIFQPGMITRALCIGLEVDSADAEFDRLRKLGVETLGRPRRQAWGELSFRVLDPAGVVINVLEQADDHDDLIEL